MKRTRSLSLTAVLAVGAMLSPAFAANAAAPPNTPAAKGQQKQPPLSYADRPSPARTKDNVEFVIGPNYTQAPEVAAQPGVPKGKIYEFTMRSTESRTYPGVARGQTGVVPYERPVYVYVPAQYAVDTIVPFIVVQDGRSYATYLPTILDNLIHEKRIPIMVAVMVQSGGSDGRGSQRGLEYDTVSDTYTNFIETEVLPRAARETSVTFTTDPEGRATLGGSSGAAAAFTMAWFRPDLYRRVLSYSGTFVNQQSPALPSAPYGAWEYHETFIPKSPRKPIRIWLHVSDQDNGATREESTRGNWVLANQRMAAALKAKGYEYRYVFSEISRHTDGRVIRQTLPGALEWLWATYKPAK